MLKPKSTKIWLRLYSIIEAVDFALKNNNLISLEETFNQVINTATRTKFTPPYKILSVGFLEETILFPVELP